MMTPENNEHPAASREPTVCQGCGYTTARPSPVDCDNPLHPQSRTRQEGTLRDRVAALHRPWYAVGGVRHDFTVMLAEEPDEGHVCRTSGIDQCTEDEHYALACQECRGSFYDGEIATHLFWPCPTIRLLDASEPDTRAAAHAYEGWLDGRAWCSCGSSFASVEEWTAYAVPDFPMPAPAVAEGTDWFREQHDRAKERNAQVPPHARMVVTNPELSAHHRPAAVAEGTDVETLAEREAEVVTLIDPALRDEHAAASYAHHEALAEYEAALVSRDPDRRATAFATLRKAQQRLSRSQHAIVLARSASTPDPVTFSALLADPTQQLDPDGVVLASVLAYQNATQATASAAHPAPAVAEGTDVRLTEAEREALRVGYYDAPTETDALATVERILAERAATRGGA